MTGFMKRLVTSVALFALMFSSLAGLSTAVAQDEDLPEVSVGSKDFTEQLVLAEMVAALLEDSGYEVNRELNLGGTAVVHEALVAGDVNVYVEYTGSGLEILDVDPLEFAGNGNGEEDATPDADNGVEGMDEVYDLVSTEYEEQFGLMWLEPWGFNNTYQLAMRGDHAEELGIETVSDLVEQSGDLEAGFTQEFLVRDDGYPGMQGTYEGLEFADAAGLDPGLMYDALVNEEVDVISAFATDGRIAAFDLVLLEDDMNFFPPYYAAPVVDGELLEQSPEVEELLNQLAGQISDEEMAELNLQVDEEGAAPEDVAQEFLTEQGLIGNGEE